MILDQPPLDDNIVPEQKPHRVWQYWFNNVHRAVDAHNALLNTHLVLNPDFHWSRTKGNTATTTDGEFVEMWDVSSNGMTFTITPTYYTDTKFSSFTGSDRYINVDISVPNSNEFVIYQRVTQGVSALQNKILNVSIAVNNNDNLPIKAKFIVGFDLDGGGVDEYYGETKAFYFQEGFQLVDLELECPAISSDTQTNVMSYYLVMNEIATATNFDIYFIKPELSGYKTPLYVDHTLEKLRIDNI